MSTIAGKRPLEFGRWTSPERCTPSLAGIVTSCLVTGAAPAGPVAASAATAVASSVIGRRTVIPAWMTFHVGGLTKPARPHRDAHYCAVHAFAGRGDRRVSRADRACGCRGDDEPRSRPERSHDLSRCPRRPPHRGGLGRRALVRDRLRARKGTAVYHRRDPAVRAGTHLRARGQG